MYCCKAASSDLFYRLEFRPHVTPTAKRSGMPRPGHVEHKFICIKYTVLSYTICISVTPTANRWLSFPSHAGHNYCSVIYFMYLHWLIHGGVVNTVMLMDCG